MTRWMVAAAASAMVLVLQPAAFAKAGWVTCTGVMVQVDMIEDPKAVIYDAGTAEAHACIVSLDTSGYSPLMGSCRNGAACTISGRYTEKTGNVYYLRDWDKAERDPLRAQ